MAYRKGDPIAAADLNGFLATTRNVYGVGTGDRGYGQTTIVQSDVTTSTVVSAVHWTNLRSMIVAAATHQATAVTDLMPTSVLDVGDVVTAHEQASPSSNAYDLDSYITAIDTNRLNASASHMTLATAAHSASRATTWSSEAITGTFTATFASEDAARHFFNSGGQLRIRLTHPNGAGTLNDDWRTICATTVGTLTISAHAFAVSGTATSAVLSKGYYELTASYQTVFNGLSIGGGSYSGNDVTVQARVLNVAGVRGGNGTVVEFLVTLNDESGGTVADGTTVAFDVYRATTLLGISAPTWATTDAL